MWNSLFSTIHSKRAAAQISLEQSILAMMPFSILAMLASVNSIKRIITTFLMKIRNGKESRKGSRKKISVRKSKIMKFLLSSVIKVSIIKFNPLSICLEKESKSPDFQWTKNNKTFILVLVTTSQNHLKIQTS